VAQKFLLEVQFIYQIYLIFFRGFRSLLWWILKNYLTRFRLTSFTSRFLFRLGGFFIFIRGWCR